MRTIFVSVLTEAHWKTRLDPEWTHQEPGLFLTVVGFNTSAVADVLEKAFRAADVPYQTMEVPPRIELFQGDSNPALRI